MTETFISVDIEASGPIPGEYSMLSIGACLVGDTGKRFYVELKPITMAFVPEAMAVCGLDLDALARHGADPAVAMARFESWLAEVTPEGTYPVFVAYPVAFDWMFVAYYFHRFLGRDPFGVSGVDVRSYYAGMMGVGWKESRKDLMDPRFHADVALTHNALDDAIVQAELFQRLLEHRP